MTFGERVRKYRKNKRLSQNALAELAGVSPRTVFGYEAGTTYPRTKDMLKRLADALGVTSEALVDGVPSLESFAFIRADRSLETQARLLTQQIVSAMLGDLPAEQKDAMAKTVMDAYWESRQKSREQNDMTSE